MTCVLIKHLLSLFYAEGRPILRYIRNLGSSDNSAFVVEPFLTIEGISMPLELFPCPWFMLVNSVPHIKLMITKKYNLLTLKICIMTIKKFFLWFYFVNKIIK